jgi:hypothetical protein
LKVMKCLVFIFYSDLCESVFGGHFLYLCHSQDNSSHFAHIYCPPVSSIPSIIDQLFICHRLLVTSTSSIL